MKNRTRLFLVVAVGVLVLGLGTGLVASYVGQNFTLIGGSGPEALSYVPADARMVAFADVHDLASSEVRQKLRQIEPSADARHQLEEATGIDIERDVDDVLVAGFTTSTTTPQGPPLAIARGRFDADRIETLIRQHHGTVEDYKGKRLLVTAEHGNMAVLFDGYRFVCRHKGDSGPSPNRLFAGAFDSVIVGDPRHEEPHPAVLRLDYRDADAGSAVICGSDTNCLGLDLDRNAVGPV